MIELTLAFISSSFSNLVELIPTYSLLNIIEKTKSAVFEIKCELIEILIDECIALTENIQSRIISHVNHLIAIDKIGTLYQEAVSLAIFIFHE